VTSTETPARTPADIGRRFEDAFNAGDIEALMALYEEDCFLVPEPGSSVQGLDAIRGALEGFLALKATFKFEPATIVENGDVALIHARWNANGTGPDGPVALTGYTSEVVRRQSDGSWKYMIDDPGIGL
jgi:uncharacterized protein (TIGR02246 family)